MIFIVVLCFIALVKAKPEHFILSTTSLPKDKLLLRNFKFNKEIVVKETQDSTKQELRDRLPERGNCAHVCDDLPRDDTQPVCMMMSRYKKGYQFFVNHCHARRTICKDNLILHMVHPTRCLKINTFFMPAS